MADNYDSLAELIAKYHAGVPDQTLNKVNQVVGTVGKNIDIYEQTMKDELARAKAELENKKMVQEQQPLWKTVGAPMQADTVISPEKENYYNTIKGQMPDIATLPENPTPEQEKRVQSDIATTQGKLDALEAQKQRTLELQKKREELLKPYGGEGIANVPTGMAKDMGLLQSNIVKSKTIWQNPNDSTQFSDTPVSGWKELRLGVQKDQTQKSTMAVGSGNYTWADIKKYFPNLPEGQDVPTKSLENAMKDNRVNLGNQFRKDVIQATTENEARKEFINRPEVKEYMTVATTIRSMDSLLKSALSGNQDNKVALDQGLITMYNKLTDPNSVVRESEYARTPENLPMINRIIGAIGKIQGGGAGLTDADREALVLGAKIIGDERAKSFNGTREEYTNLASISGWNPQRVVGTVPVFNGSFVSGNFGKSEPTQPKPSKSSGGGKPNPDAVKSKVDAMYDALKNSVGKP